MYATELRQGDTFRRKLSLTYKDSGNPVDLSECAAYCQLRRSPGKALILTASAAIDGESILVTLTKDQTKTLEAGEYGFDVRLESANDRWTLYTEWITVKLPFTERE